MGTGSSIGQRLNLPEAYRYERVVNRFAMQPGERRVFADLQGPGCIRHLYCIVGGRGRSGDSYHRSYILRIYWDEEETPSVEVPVADFFGIHHSVAYYPINTHYLSVKDDAGLACYFPMPFGRSARFEVEAGEGGHFIYTLDWHKYLTDEIAEDLRFHAAWRRENPAPAWGEDFLAMDAVGRGYLLGFFLGVRLRSGDQRWTHAGSENLYIDGEATGSEGIVPHYIRAAGGENTFDAAYGGVKHKPDTYLYAGIPYLEHWDTGSALAHHVVSAYKFYVHDLIPFNESLHFRWGSQANDMCMTTYWYQTEPHRRFVRMPSFADLRYGGWRDEVEIKRGQYDLLRQLGATGPDAVWASPDDGTWLLWNGDEVLGKPVTAARGGVRRPAIHGFVDFSHVFNVGSTGSNVTWPASATALTTLSVDRDTPATLHLSWDDDMKIRINDGGVRDLGNHQSYQYQAVSIDLHQGSNTLRINLDNPGRGVTWGAWAYSCRVVLPDGSVVVPRSPETSG